MAPPSSLSSSASRRLPIVAARSAGSAPAIVARNVTMPRFSKTSAAFGAEASAASAAGASARSSARMSAGLNVVSATSAREARSAYRVLGQLLRRGVGLDVLDVLEGDDEQSPVGLDDEVPRGERLLQLDHLRAFVRGLHRKLELHLRAIHVVDGDFALVRHCRPPHG